MWTVCWKRRMECADLLRVWCTVVFSLKHAEPFVTCRHSVFTINALFSLINPDLFLYASIFVITSSTATKT